MTQGFGWLYSRVSRYVAPLMALAVVTLLQGNQISRAEDANLEALIKAAKAEGSLLMYTAMPDPDSRRLVAAFKAKYGIDINFVRLSSGPLQTRFASEAQAGVFAADILFTGAGELFTADGVKRGLLQPVSAAKLPVVEAKDIPARFPVGDFAVVQIMPWGIGYNTNELKPDALPKDWADLLDPKYKGKILMPDPTVTDSYMYFWAAIVDRYGVPFIEKLKQQQVRVYSSGVPAAQALAAGEGFVQIPSLPVLVNPMKEKGAPVDFIPQNYTVAVEMQMVLPAADKVKHPNAARLLANFALSKEGDAILSAVPGAVSMYETGKLPTELQPNKISTYDRKPELDRLLKF